MTSEIDLLAPSTVDQPIHPALSKEKVMTNFNAIARGYIDLWNERTPSRRREILSESWTTDAKYVDPLMNGDGP